MREILFQGFHPCEDGKQTIKIDGKIIQGDWVEGSVIKYCYGELTERYLKTIHKNTVVSDGLRYGFSIQDSAYQFPEYDVIPQTVRQFTGLTDKSGKRIFEGDRVLHLGEMRWATVEFSKGKFTCERSGFNISASNNFKVIGTIYDAEVEE